MTQELGSLDQFIEDIEPLFYRQDITYVDVGAHEGNVLKKMLSSRLVIGEAHLFEPNPKSFEVLKQTAEREFKKRSLNLYNVAVGAKKTNVRMQAADTMTRVVDEGVKDHAAPSDNANTFVVKCLTLDDLAKSFADGRISLLKVDVEGFEAQVLDGASKLLKEQRIDVVYIEAGADPASNQQCYYRIIDDIMLRHGYRLFRIYEQKHEWMEDLPFLRRMNLAYFSRRFAETRPYSLVRELFDTQKQKRALERDLASAQKRTAELSRQLQARDAEAADLAAKLDAQQAREAELSDRLQAREAEVTEAAAALEAQQAREGELARQLRKRDAEAAEWAASLESQKAREAELTGQLQALEAQQAREAELVRQLQALEADLAETGARLEAQRAREGELSKALVRRDAAIDELFASTSWRVTAPMRRLGNAFPWLARNGRRSLKLTWWIVTGQFGRIRTAVRTARSDKAWQAKTKAQRQAQQAAASQPAPHNRGTKSPSPRKAPKATQKGEAAEKEATPSLVASDGDSPQPGSPSPPAALRRDCEIVLFTSYFRPAQADRQKEIDFCLEKNVQCRGISRIVLLCDEGVEPPVADPKITTVPAFSRPTYRQWVDLSEELPAGSLSVLANSDIYFDDTIAELGNVLTEDLRFVALSRHERLGTALQPHRKPHWSQDVWAFRTGAKIGDGLRSALDVPLGVPRCDNKVAYLFAIHGWQLVNPVSRIIAAHVHESQLRTYNKAEDVSVLGAVAYVHPSDPYTEPAKVDIDVWVIDSAMISGVKLNKSLERGRSAKWLGAGKIAADRGTGAGADGSAGGSPAQRAQPNGAGPAGGQGSDILPAGHAGAGSRSAAGVQPVVDIAPLKVDLRPSGPDDCHFWQYPCLTEKEALDRHLGLAADSNVDPEQGIVHTYLGLPWATYIDKRHDLREVTDLLAPRLREARERARSCGLELAVHTVCQHYAWHRLGTALAEIGVTDLHLSHCTGEVVAHLSESDIRAHSWPLYAVNYEDPSRSAGLLRKPASEKRYLASFIGAYMPHYRSDVRLRLRQAAERDGGSDILVELGDQWHFNPIVYGEQVKNKALDRVYLDRHFEETERYNRIISDSVFSLCPEGAGPNSLRLWESLAVGSIPVVLADGWVPPVAANGGHALEDACIVMGTAEVGGLFERLRRTDAAEIAARQAACIALYAAMKEKRTFKTGPAGAGSRHEAGQARPSREAVL